MEIFDCWKVPRITCTCISLITRIYYEKSLSKYYFIIWNKLAINIGTLLVYFLATTVICIDFYWSNLVLHSKSQHHRITKKLKCVTDTLTQIINWSHEQGIFPKDLKVAASTFPYKAKDPVLFNNDGPNLLLSVFLKSVSIWWINHSSTLQKDYTFDKYQFWIRYNYATSTRLNIFIENSLNLLDNGIVHRVYNLIFFSTGAW